MHADKTRRRFLQFGGGVAIAPRVFAQGSPVIDRFRYCLNTATLQGYKLSLPEMIDAAGTAGYNAIEPWLTAITAYTGPLGDIRKRLSDHGLTVESAIAFAQWIVDDPAKRAAALEQMRREMDLVTQIGGRRIAAPPAGANNAAPIELSVIVERYRAVLELGDRMGVVPELEFWGPSTNLHRLSQAMFVVLETGHPKACVLADVYHLYKGGSGFAGLPQLSAQAIQVIHMNDYPADPPRDRIADRDRVYPGDGVAPLKQILRDLHRVNPELVLSLELFNANYWKTDPLDTAKAGLTKMKQAVRSALA
jgi:sugar phosphate isomerase/epimerase